MNSMGIAYYLANLVNEIRESRITEEERIIIRQHFLDAIAAAFIGAGNRVLDGVTQLSPRIQNKSHQPSNRLEEFYPLDCSMLWAFSINASVFEDGSREGACHPAAVIFPIILALSKGKDWETLDKAVIAGYDIMIRLARSGNPEFTKRGFHPTAITAPFGAAATASFLLGHNINTIQQSLCLAALGCSGLMSAFRKGETQPLQVAWSVRNGLYAALMAGMGYGGYEHIIEEGFYPAYLGRAPYPPIDAPLERKYAIQSCYLKPYPGCRHVHPSIDALNKILNENRIDHSHINKIKVRTYRIAIETEIHTLNKRGDAYFNIPYALSARLILGKNDWDAYNEKYFSNEKIVEIMKKVNVELDQDIDSRYPEERGSIVEIELQEGKSLHGEVRYPLGEPENPIPFEFTIEKFRQAAHPFLSEEEMNHLEKIRDVTGLTTPPEILFESLKKKKK